MTSEPDNLPRTIKYDKLPCSMRFYQWTVNTKLYPNNAELQSSVLNFRLVLDSKNQLHSIQHIQAIFRNLGNVEIDDRKLPIGNKIHQALFDKVDLIMILRPYDLDLNVYSIIFRGHRYCLKMEQILDLIVGES